ncbi:double-stranded RNA-binding protein Staufen homolog 2 isoform X2 [Orussus abietinus]|uniref:double-stranded RNA-binding protein Staufen homolog 2 isoform X2 n=1 Tax=Orussus abietinus TaxID=222816 RepID=UPI0006265FCE|nr:double-stranded RNA-binding protein Staufen homolog 2 isoform X2 [Orussus abietinus]
MLRHQHHTMMQNQYAEPNRVGGPMRPMQPPNLALPHQPPPQMQTHRNLHGPHHQHILSMPPHPQQHVHQMQHAGKPHRNPRPPLLMGGNSQNGTMVNVGMKEQNVATLRNQNIQQTQYDTQQNIQEQQQQQQQNSEKNKSPTNEDKEESTDQNPEVAEEKGKDHENVTNSNLANTKEKTPMCLVNELARFNKIPHQYRLTNEQGPAHKKEFTVLLRLGEEEYVAQGPSIKKAQHSAAAEALEKSWYKTPPPKSARTMRIGHPGKWPAGRLPPTVELNTLAMKRGEPTVYTFRHAPPAAPQPFVTHGFNNFPRIYNARYPTYNRGFHTEPQGLYLVTLKVGEREFTGKGMTGQTARHDAASRALEQLRQLPLPEEASNTCAVSENGTVSGIDDPNAELKSPVSLVHETALKRGLPVNFEVIYETGKPHIRTFMTRCTVGEKVTVGEGSSKKVSKKRAAELMLEELKRLPPLPVNVQNRSLQRLKRKPPATKKKPRNLIKVLEESRPGSETTEDVNPISRLVQIQQGKRERDPVYNLIEEKGAPRRREFVMGVTLGKNFAQGSGPNKKLAKRAAAEALLVKLGYNKPQPLPTKSSIKTGDSENSTTEGKPRKVTFLEDERQTEKKQPNIVGGTTGRQIAPGLLLVDGGQESKLIGGGPSVQVVAEKLRGQQQQRASLGLPPKDRLTYLAQLLGFHVMFTDFPKALYKGYLSLVSLSTDPPQVCHGHGPTKSASRDQAALTALRTLSKLGLDNVSPTQPKKDKGASGDGMHVGNQVKTNMLNGAVDK